MGWSRIRDIHKTNPTPEAIFRIDKCLSARYLGEKDHRTPPVELMGVPESPVSLNLRLFLDAGQSVPPWNSVRPRKPFPKTIPTNPRSNAETLLPFRQLFATLFSTIVENNVALFIAKNEKKNLHAVFRLVILFSFTMKNYYSTPTFLAALAIFLTTGLSVRADVWANDPYRNHIREASNLPDALNEETLLWEKDTGAKHQYPMPAVVDDMILVGGDAEGNPDELWAEAADHGATMVAYSLKDGSEIWRLIVPQGGYGPGTYGTCGMPVVDGDRIYILSMYEVFCLDLNGLADGNDGMTGELEIMTRSPFKLPEGKEMPTELPDWSADIIWHYSLEEFDLKVQDATSSTILKVGDQLWLGTAHEIGSRAKAYGKHGDVPHLLVLDARDGSLIARDQMDVPIVFHGEWSSPTLIEANGERAVVYPDGYGVLHCFGIPTPSDDGSVVTLEEYWQMDLNLPEWRVHPDGREKVYTLDKRLDYKYPPDYYSDPTRFYMYNDEAEQEAGSRLGVAPDGEHWSGFSRSFKTLADGAHETQIGPSEIISMPVFHNGKIYIGVGRDGAYGLSRAKGRFLCLQVTDVKQKPEILWEDREVARTQSSASVYDGLVYCADGQGFLNCWDAETGEVIYRLDLDVKQVKEGSQMIADDKIYINGRGGWLFVVSAGRDPEILSRSRIKSDTGTLEMVDGLVIASSHGDLLVWGDAEALPE